VAGNRAGVSCYTWGDTGSAKQPTTTAAFDHRHTKAYVVVSNWRRSPSILVKTVLSRF